MGGCRNQACEGREGELSSWLPFWIEALARVILWCWSTEGLGSSISSLRQHVGKVVDGLRVWPGRPAMLTLVRVASFMSVASGQGRFCVAVLDWMAADWGDGSSQQSGWRCFLLGFDLGFRAEARRFGFPDRCEVTSFFQFKFTYILFITVFISFNDSKEVN